MAQSMKRISTHVLDTALGKPASAVPVRLERFDAAGQWQKLASAETDQDGRISNLLPENDALPAARYRLVFGTGSYFAAHGIPGLYPVVEITFDVRAGESHFHIPLLLSPNGYTTYRGS
jgi:5-hydroxyisourate hydrolase